MHIPNYVNNILHTLQQAGYAAYVVGGCVRDHFLGTEPQDYDIATAASPEQVIRIFPKTVPTGLKHGTVTVLSPEGACEVTTFRVDGPYRDKRRPEYVHFSQAIEEDLARRDFTINAMAYDGERFVDPFHGREDILHQRIRAVGNPGERLEEDALRMLRAVRFAAQLHFRIEAKTKAAISQHAHLLQSISAERIRDELSKLLLSPYPLYGLQLLQELGLIAFVLPELAPEQTPSQVNDSLPGQQGFSFSNRLAKSITVLEYTPAHLAVRLAALLNNSQTARKVLRRLRFSRQIITLVTSLLREVEYTFANWEKGQGFAKWSLVDIKKMVVRVGPKNVDLLFQLLLARAKAGHILITEQEILQLREKVKRILAENHPLTLQDLAITGRDLLQLGQAQGPEIGQTLHCLLELVLADPRLNTKETLLNLVNEIKKS